MRNFKVKEKTLFYQASSSPSPSHMRKVPIIAKFGPLVNPQREVIEFFSSWANSFFPFKELNENPFPTKLFLKWWWLLGALATVYFVFDVNGKLLSKTQASSSKRRQEGNNLNLREPLACVADVSFPFPKKHSKATKTVFAHSKPTPPSLAGSISPSGKEKAERTDGW